jgi:hypothetical protein
MGTLSTKQRNALPASKFAGPNNSYPIPDKSHAINAKARAQEMYNEHKITLNERNEIDAKANAVINK